MHFYTLLLSVLPSTALAALKDSALQQAHAAPHGSATKNPEHQNEADTLVRRNGALCNHYYIDAGNREAAVDNLLKICGSGWGIDAKALTAQVGDTFAYICNYSGTDRQCIDSEARGLFEQIKIACGADGAGFYANDDWHVNFGVAKVGNGIC